MSAGYWSMAYHKSTLVAETDLLSLAVFMPIKTTIKARLLTIAYVDMKRAVEKVLEDDFSYSCHGDIFEISRHEAPIKARAAGGGDV